MFNRSMLFYPVTESELESFGTMNMLTNTLFTIGVGLITLAIGIAVNAGFEEKLSPAGAALTVFVAPAFGVIGFAFLCVCLVIRRKRDAAWDRIKTSAQTIET